jgi:hypothetical protein
MFAATLILNAVLMEGCAMPAPPPPAPPAPAPAVAAAAAPIRVIAELRPAPGLKLRAAIARAQDEVIASLPPGQAHVVQRYATLPLLGLELDPGLIERLRQNPAVVRVSPDEQRTMQSD